MSMSAAYQCGMQLSPILRQSKGIHSGYLDIIRLFFKKATTPEPPSHSLRNPYRISMMIGPKDSS